MDKRLSWEEYFMDIVDVVAKRATCDRGRSGAIIVMNRRIIATGYVGSPPGQPHCDEVGHLMWKTIDDQGQESNHCIRTLHAEENAILQAAEFGVSVKGATLFCKMTPCFQRCAMKIVRVGIVRVVAQRKYHAGARSEKLFKDAGVELKILENKVEEYRNQ
ncbi:MAG: cytidine/deoxycytidylate deaminase family protein [Pseudomonadota bacterium]